MGRHPVAPSLAGGILFAAAMAASPLGCDMDYGELFGADAGAGAAAGSGAATGSGAAAGGGTGGYGGSSALCIGCSAPMLCHETFGCVECESGDDCVEPGASHCVNYQCEQCEHNSNCESGNRCHPSVYRCSPTCETASDCDGMGVATLCNEYNLCVECESAADCTTPICHPERGRCVECVAASDCPGDRPLCRPADGACVQCLVSTDCGAGGRCVDNTCLAG